MAVWSDVRRTGQVHPAWRLGIGVMIAVMLLTEAITYSPVGATLYRVATAGSQGAAIAPLKYPAPPWALRPVSAWLSAPPPRLTSARLTHPSVEVTAVGERPLLVAIGR